MRRLLLPLAALPLLAQAPDPPAKPDMIIVPRALFQNMLTWMESPNPNNAVMLHYLATACLNDNPSPSGAITRVGPDQCPDVTAAVKAHDGVKPAPAAPPAGH